MNLKYTTIEFKDWSYSTKCKPRIENSLKVNGISKAKWNKRTKMLTAVFNPKIVSFVQIRNSFCRLAK